MNSLKTFRVANSSIIETDNIDKIDSIVNFEYIEIQAKSYMDAFKKSIPIFLANEKYVLQPSGNIILVVSGRKGYFQCFKCDNRKFISFLPPRPVKSEYTIERETVFDCSVKFKLPDKTRNKTYTYCLVKNTTNKGNETYWFVNKSIDFSFRDNYIVEIDKVLLKTFTPNVVYENVLAFDDFFDNRNFKEYLGRAKLLGRWSIVPVQVKEYFKEIKHHQTRWKIYYTFENATDAVMAKLSI